MGVSVEVRSEADMLYAHYLGGMAKMLDGVDDGGLSVCTKETLIYCGLCHTIGFCQSSHLIVGEIAWMIAKSPCRTMAAYDGNFAE